MPPCPCACRYVRQTVAEAEPLILIHHWGAPRHSPLVDAQVSMRLYNEFVCQPKRLKKAVEKLHRMTIYRGFPEELMAANQIRNIDGVCGYAFDPSLCVCGQPTLRETV